MKKKTKFALGALATAGAYIYTQRPDPRRGDMPKLRRWRYAHRGLHNLAQGIAENTLPAFKAAFDGGYGAELDVHLTFDGKLAVIHDSELGRLCGNDGIVEDMTYDELSQFTILGTNDQAPLLCEVLDIFREGNAPLVIELKTHNGNHEALCIAVSSALEGYNAPYCIESFDPNVVWWFAKNQPGVIRGQLSANFMKNETIPFARRFGLTNMLSNPLARPDFVAYRYADRAGVAPRISCDLIGRAEVSWTINSLPDMLHAESEGALVIFEGFRP